MDENQGYTYQGEKVYWLGAAGIRDFTVVQNYKTIKNECVKSGKLFEDPEFPPTGTWLRPKEISKNPSFFKDKTTRFDFKQGDINDTWLMAVVASLTIHPNNLFRVVCQDNKFGADYCGIVHFRFWQYGKWVDVVIDDRLPVDRYRKLLWLSSKDEDVFWPALLEKAYQKFCGGYKPLRLGDAHEALEDFMGSPTEVYDLKESRSDLYEIIKESLDKTSLITCGIKNQPYGNEIISNEGIIQNRAYIVTKAREIELDLPFPCDNVKIRLIRLKNPWGEVEWNGPWSDGSVEWKITSSEERAKFGIAIDHDGEFWMSFDDFLMRFDELSICTNRSQGDDEKNGSWKWTEFNGEWVKGKSAGGCLMNKTTFHLNPQYVIKLEEPDKNDNKGPCSIFLSLTQKNRRSREGANTYISLGYVIYKLEQYNPDDGPIGEMFFRFTQPLEYTSSFTKIRGITARLNLSAGQYLIVPSSFDSSNESQFLLRVYHKTMKKAVPEEDTEKEEIPEKKEEPVKRDDMVVPDDIPSEPIDNPEWDDVEKLFKNAAGKNEVIDWVELKKILDTTIPKELFESDLYKDFKTEGFSKETCRSIVAMMDTNYSKTLTLDEFRKFYQQYSKWKEAFKTYDSDENHVIGPFELQDAMEAAGFVLDSGLINMLVYRFGNDNNVILFSDFIVCALKVKMTIESFKRKVKDDSNVATFQTYYATQESIYS